MLIASLGLEKSVDNGAWIAEASYEVKGDSVCMGAPQKGRFQKQMRVSFISLSTFDHMIMIEFL